MTQARENLRAPLAEVRSAVIGRHPPGAPRLITVLMSIPSLDFFGSAGSRWSGIAEVVDSAGRIRNHLMGARSHTAC